MNRIFRMFEEDGETQLTQVDADGIAHIAHDYAVPVSIVVTVTRGDWTFDAELPICTNAFCSLCHPTSDVAGTRVPVSNEPAPLPSAFAYLHGEPNA